MNWWQALLAGGAVGLVFIPIFVGISKLFRNLSQRKQIKRMIKRKQFLIPIDTKDYDVFAWRNEINPENYKDDVKNLNAKLFKKDITEVQHG